MKTTTVETSKLTGPALDWAVAIIDSASEDVAVYSPSTNWSQGGPLIERYCGFTDCQDAEQIEPFYAETRCSNPKGYANGATILIAVCRAFVAAELGDDVEVSAELVEVKNG